MDVDLRADLIQVRRGWDQVEGEIEPKSPSAKRSIPILSIRRGYLIEQSNEPGGRGGIVSLGAPPKRSSMPRPWTAALSAPGALTTPPSARRRRGRGGEPELLTLLTMHECRHTFASVLIDTGTNPKAIQDVMGHSKIQTTLTSMATFCLAAMTTFAPGWTPIWPPSGIHPSSGSEPAGGDQQGELADGKDRIASGKRRADAGRGFFRPD